MDFLGDQKILSYSATPKTPFLEVLMNRGSFGFEVPAASVLDADLRRG